MNDEVDRIINNLVEKETKADEMLYWWGVDQANAYKQTPEYKKAKKDYKELIHALITKVEDR